MVSVDGLVVSINRPIVSTNESGRGSTLPVVYTPFFNGTIVDDSPGKNGYSVFPRKLCNSALGIDNHLAFKTLLVVHFALNPAFALHKPCIFTLGNSKEKSQALGQKNTASIFPNGVRIFLNGVSIIPKDVRVFQHGAYA